MTPKNFQDVVDAYDDDAAVHRQVGESGVELQFVVMINLRLIRGWYMGVSKNRGTPKYMDYNGKPY